MRFWSSPASIDVLGVVGLVGLAAMVALTNGYTAFQYRGGTLLCSILTLMVIAACVQPQGMVARALSAERSCGLASARTASTCGTIRYCCS